MLLLLLLLDSQNPASLAYRDVRAFIRHAGNLKHTAPLERGVISWDSNYFITIYLWIVLDPVIDNRFYRQNDRKGNRPNGNKSNEEQHVSKKPRTRQNKTNKNYS